MVAFCVGCSNGPSTNKKGGIMKKSVICSFLAVISIFIIVGCGGGSSSSSSGTTPAADILGPDGSVITSLDVATPVAASVSGLTANTQYIIKTTDPSGNVVCTTSVFTDNNGAIPASPYCYIRDKDTAIFTSDGTVDAMVVKDDEIANVFSHGKAITTGDYHFSVFDSAGTEVISKSSGDSSGYLINKAIPVTNTAARVCASNSSGLCGRSFLVGTSHVYATIEQGTGVDEGEVVDIYVVSDRCNVGYAIGSSLQDVSSDGANTNVTVNYSAAGLFTSPAIWNTPASAGVYDVIIDVDQSGTYTAGDLVEIIDPTPTAAANPGGLCGVGFTVQSAFSTATDVIVQIAMDKNRAYQDVFSKGRGDDIYAQLQSTRRLAHNFGVRKYVVAHKDAWSDGDTLTDIIDPTVDEVQTGCTNQQRRLVAPINLMPAGCYDLVFDVNANGVYDKGSDAVDNIDLNGNPTCGFIVVDDAQTVTVDSIKNQEGTEVKDGTSTSISGKVTITGTASTFSDTATVKGYAVVGSSQGASITGTIVSGAFTITNMPLLSGDNLVKISITEGVGSSATKFGSAVASVTWQPGGSSSISIQHLVTWTTSGDMDTHFIKTGGAFAGSGDVSKTDDCHWLNCPQSGSKALNWTTAAGSQTTSSDESTGAIARLDLDCVPSTDPTCASSPAETSWIKLASGVIPKAGNFLLCVYAFDGTGTPSAQVTVNGIAQLPLTAPSAITNLDTNDTWFVGYTAQDASGNLTWHAVNQVGTGATICTQP